MNKRIQSQNSPAEVKKEQSLRDKTVRTRQPLQPSNPERGADRKAESIGWSLSAIRSYLFSSTQNALDDKSSTKGVFNTSSPSSKNRTDDKIRGGAVKQEQRCSPNVSTNGTNGAPEEREAWRFADTVYEAALTRVS